MITTDKVKELFASINGNIDAADLDEDVKLSDQGIGSLDTFDFFLTMEEENGIKVSDEQMEKLDTIQKIVEYANEQK